MVAPNLQKQALLTQEHLRAYLDYDQSTGFFRYKTTCHNRRKIGDVAGCEQAATGYVVIKIKGHTYVAHRLAWLYVYGEWPDGQIDHIDNDKANNRLQNLREVTNQQNQFNIAGLQKNNTSGARGVSKNKNDGLWWAHIGINGKLHHLGRFHRLEDAAAARRKAELEHFCEFAPSLAP